LNILLELPIQLGFISVNFTSEAFTEGKVDGNKTHSKINRTATVSKAYSVGVTVNQTSMSSAMTEYAKTIAIEAWNRYDTSLNMAIYIRNGFQTKYGGSWNCIVGDYAYAFYFPNKNFIILKLSGVLQQVAVTISQAQECTSVDRNSSPYIPIFSYFLLLLIILSTSKYLFLR